MFPRVDKNIVIANNYPDQIMRLAYQLFNEDFEKNVRNSS